MKQLAPESSDYTVILRFLGTTPASSSILLAFKSIVNQLAVIFPDDLDDVPKAAHQMDSLDVSQSKDLLLTCLNSLLRSHPTRKILIFLDSIDQLNKTDYSLDEWFIRDAPANTKLVYSTLTSHHKRADEDENVVFTRIAAMKLDMLEVGKLSKSTAWSILDMRMKRDGREITSEQRAAVENVLDNKSVDLYPLFVQLVYDQIFYWKSYTRVDDGFARLSSIDDCIRYLFASLERTFGKMLVSRCFFYITAFSEGISESELEDVLSLDDELLYELFEYHEPPIRRFPLALWNRIKSRIEVYLNRKVNFFLFSSLFIFVI